MAVTWLLHGCHMQSDLAVENVVGSVLLEAEVPHEGHAIGVVGDVGVGVVGDQQQLRVLV